MWHMTPDMWGDVNILSKFLFLALTVWEWRCLEDVKEKDELLTHWINYNGVCRTALATPSLLKRYNIEYKLNFEIYAKSNI